MKKIKLISWILAAALLIPNVVFAQPQTVATDSDIEWTMNWSGERNQEGMEWLTSELDTQNGLKIDIDTAKMALFNQYKYASKDNGKTKCEEQGEYQYYVRFDSEGNPVAYDENDTTSRIVRIYWQGRDNFTSTFKVGETENNGEPIVLSYDFTVKTVRRQSWEAPYVSFMGFTFYFNLENRMSLTYNDGTANKTLDLGKYDGDKKHNVKMVIAPEVTDGRYKINAIMMDGEVVSVENVYSRTNGKTDADCYLSKIDFMMRLSSSQATASIENLNVSRGFDPMTASTDFVDGSEITADGIDITASEILDKDTLDVTVYDCDFDDDVISNPGMVMTNNGKNVNIKFTKLEAGGNYRAEITGIQDIWGNTYDDTLSISFKTPAAEGGSGDVDDTPNGEGSGTEIEVGDIKLDSSLFHGYQFTTFNQENGEYEVRVDSKSWYDAEQNRYAKNGAYYYLKDGVETYLGSDDAWNRIDLTIKVGEIENPKKPLVVSFDWYAENSGGAGEWSSNFIKAMGIQCNTPDSTAAKTLLKYYKDGLNKTETPSLKGSTDGWHSYKLVFGSDLTEGRPQLTAAIVDGEITFYDDVYSQSTFKSEDEYKITGVTLQITAPGEAKAANGDTVVKVRNLNVERIDGLEAEMFMLLGKQNPKDDIKLNFNYPISDKLTAEDFSIFEVNGEEETEIPNTLTVSKAYDNKQVIINVGDGGLYYDKEYKLVINKKIVVNEYIGVGKKSYDFATYEYPDDLAVELTKSGSTINYTISGGDEDSFVIMAATYDKDGALVGLNRIVTTKQGSGNRRKAKGSISAKNTTADTTVNMYIFTSDGMTVHRMPMELQ